MSDKPGNEVEKFRRIFRRTVAATESIVKEAPELLPLWLHVILDDGEVHMSLLTQPSPEEETLRALASRFPSAQETVEAFLEDRSDADVPTWPKDDLETMKEFYRLAFQIFMVMQEHVQGLDDKTLRERAERILETMVDRLEQLILTASMIFVVVRDGKAEGPSVPPTQE